MVQYKVGLAVFNIGERNKQICQFIRILDASSNWDDIRVSKFYRMFKIIYCIVINIIDIWSKILFRNFHRYNNEKEFDRDIE